MNKSSVRKILRGKSAMCEASAKQKETIEGSIIKSLPWAFSCFGRQVEIETFSDKTLQWETIAIINSIHGMDAEDIAHFITEKVNVMQHPVGKNLGALDSSPC